MSEKFFHSTGAASWADRESFNNTILLLTMVKSEYYYIVGFSRPRNKIEIAFDFKSGIHGTLTEYITVGFSSDEEYIIIESELKNVGGSAASFAESYKSKGDFGHEGDRVTYVYKLKKDSLIPMGIERMNSFILSAKAELIGFLESYYSHCIRE